MKNRTTLLRHRRSIDRRHPSAFLLAAQLLSLFLYVVLDEKPTGHALLRAFGVLVLVLVFWVINNSRTVRWIAWVLVAPAFVVSLLSVFIDNPALVIGAALLEAVVYIYAAGSLIAYMMKDTRVTVDELYAVGATFTLLAWGFANAYVATETWYPGSFTTGIDPASTWTFIEFLSLSFTNLTATGLGDLLPVSTLARVLVMLEQFAGIGYVAVVVSRLIGMTISNRQSRNTP
jgi:hypothetical protein